LRRVVRVGFGWLGGFGWVGGGGSYVYADTATGTSFAMTKTRLTPHFNTAQRLADLTTAEINPHA